MTDASKITAQGGAGKRVLVVDDEFDIAYTYSMLFEFHGFVVSTARDGREALAAALLEPPDVVVSDYMMPVMDGVDLFLALRAHPATAAIPFVMTSAGRLREDVAVPVGAFLRKPVVFDELLSVVLKLLDVAP